MLIGANATSNLTFTLILILNEIKKRKDVYCAVVLLTKWDVQIHSRSLKKIEHSRLNYWKMLPMWDVRFSHNLTFYISSIPLIRSINLTIKKRYCIYFTFLLKCARRMSCQSSGTNACGNKNAGCSHLCLAHPLKGSDNGTDYYCACPTHYTLDSNKKTCSGILRKIII